MRFPRRFGDSASDDGRDAGDGRNFRLGVGLLGIAALVVVLVVVNLNRPSPWGIAAAVVWLMTLLIMSRNYLSRIRRLPRQQQSLMPS